MVYQGALSYQGSSDAPNNPGTYTNAFYDHIFQKLMAQGSNLTINLSLSCII